MNIFWKKEEISKLKEDVKKSDASIHETASKIKEKLENAEESGKSKTKVLEEAVKDLKKKVSI